MAAVWDTTLASRLKPDSPAHDYCLERLADGDTVFVAARAVVELAHGYQQALDRRPEFGTLLRWIENEVVDERVCTVIAFDAWAAFIAGRLRAQAPLPPARKGDKRSKAARRRSWHVDLDIAATCFAAGHDVATENVDDFARIADVLTELYPTAPRLEVVIAPF